MKSGHILAYIFVGIQMIYGEDLLNLHKLETQNILK
jgi:hypothetical protein